MLDMSEAEFLELVAASAMPAPKRFGELERWDVSEIQAIVKGEARLPKEEFEV